MKGIVRVNNFESLLKRIKLAPLIAEQSSKVIGIDGCGGAGKSTFAKKLSLALANCQIVPTDDFATPKEPIDWYKRMLEQVLVPIKKNKLATYQKYDWQRGRLSDWIEVSPAPYLIVEGVSSYRKEFRPYINFGIYIETSRALRLRRGLERDGEDAKEQWLQWMKEEDRYISEHRPQDNADIILSGEH